MKIWNRSPRERLLAFLFICIAIFAGFFLRANFLLNKQFKLEAEKEEKMSKIFSALNLEAKSFFIYDITKEKRIYGLNENEVRPLASLTKIMTAITALRQRDQNDIVKIDSDSLQEEGDTGLFANEVWRLSDLIKLTLISSSNDGAMSLGRDSISFVEKMNNTAKEIGILESRFFNPTGLDSRDKPGGLGTARESAMMLYFGLKNYPEIFGATARDNIKLKSLSGFSHEVINTDILAGQIDGLLASKTGFTDLAGGNLVIVFEPDSHNMIAITVLGSSYNGRFEDMKKLIETTKGILENE